MGTSNKKNKGGNHRQNSDLTMSSGWDDFLHHLTDMSSFSVRSGFRLALAVAIVSFIAVALMGASLASSTPCLACSEHAQQQQHGYPGENGYHHPNHDAHGDNIISDISVIDSEIVHHSSGFSDPSEAAVGSSPGGSSQVQFQHVTDLDRDIVFHNVVDGPDIAYDSNLSPGNPHRSTLSMSGDIISEAPAYDVFVEYNLAERNPVTVLPDVCPDGYTYGFGEWSTLRDAVAEANVRSAESFIRWNDYRAALDDYERRILPNPQTQHLPPPTQPLPEEPPEPFVICPGVTITNPKGRHAKMGPIFVDAEDITIECDMCVVDVGGTHLSFGPNARNALIRGITFRGAQSSSLTFHYHGADAVFEDCQWIGNSGSGNSGAVADLNSTSSVSFYRCEISDTRQNPRKAQVGAGVANVPGMNPPNNFNGGQHNSNAGGSSLTIRN